MFSANIAVFLRLSPVSSVFLVIAGRIEIFFAAAAPLAENSGFSADLFLLLNPVRLVGARFIAPGRTHRSAPTPCVQ
jgi:hypothetical protein